MKRFRFVLVFLTTASFITMAVAQDDIAYKTPPKVIEDMLLVKPTPGVSSDDKGEWILFTQSNSYPSVEELAQPEYRIAGLRINPNNFSYSRQNFINDIWLKNTNSGKEFKIAGLPSPLMAGSVRWSPTDKKIAFTHTMENRVDLYVVDLATRKAIKINTRPVNTLVAGPYQWVDDQSILYRIVVKPATAAPVRSLMPAGPTVNENFGKAAPRPTYQDLIKSPFDEQLFGFFTTSQLVIYKNGQEIKIGSPAIYDDISVSPDKRFMMITTIRRPFSYLVPARGFPSVITITDINGKPVKKLAELPSSETAPSGYDNVQNVPRSFSWRSDEPATVTWCQPLDSGLIKNQMDHHDAVYALTAPFNQPPKELFRTSMRYANVQWGNNRFALVTEILRSKQMIRTCRYNPSTGSLETLFERNMRDAYSDPGDPVTAKNQWGEDVIRFLDNGNSILMNNTSGSSPEGDLPFLAKFDLETGKSTIVWRCDDGHYEMVTKVLDPEKLLVLTRRESESEMPNYWIRNLKMKGSDRQVTSFQNPYPQLAGVSKEKISYKRGDGIDLTGELYLPDGYDKSKDGPLPVIIWAYPREFNSASDAAQIRGSAHRFTLLSWSTPVFYVTQGYAVLNNAEMPIVATDTSKRPNDDFVEQLRLNAEAAIDKLADMGVGDRNRVAVGGHSYGAFMTANLLAHTSLFKAGIARSGAYNRTLTPFGFQNEDRTYWEAPDLYNTMSPFMHADKLKTPILLIHGDADNNTGTYPIQSERMFNAIKGHGGTVKYVSLPYESHGYRGKENILHMLYEQYAWLEKFVKNAAPGDQKRAF